MLKLNIKVIQTGIKVKQILNIKSACTYVLRCERVKSALEAFPGNHANCKTNEKNKIK